MSLRKFDWRGIAVAMVGVAIFGTAATFESFSDDGVLQPLGVGCVVLGFALVVVGFGMHLRAMARGDRD